MMQDAVIGTGMKAGAVDMTVNQILTAVQKQDKQEITRLRTELRNKVDTRGGDQLNKNSPIIKFLDKLSGFEKSVNIDPDTGERTGGPQTMLGRAISKQLKDIGVNVGEHEQKALAAANEANKHLATLVEQGKTKPGAPISTRTNKTPPSTSSRNTNTKRMESNK